MSWPLHVTVAAVVERDNQYLLVRESIAGQSVLNQPAGHLENNESLVEAVVRETLEETAWHFEPNALVGIYRWLNPAGDTFLRFCFTGVVSDRDAGRSLDTGIEDVVWFDRRTLAKHESSLRSPLVLRCIDDYIAGTRIDLSILKEIK